MAHELFTEENHQYLICDYLSAGKLLRNRGWPAQAPVELNSFSNISSNIVSVVLRIFLYIVLVNVNTFWAKLNWGMLAGGKFGNGLEQVFSRSVTDVLYIQNTDTFFNLYVTNYYGGKLLHKGRYDRPMEN